MVDDRDAVAHGLSLLHRVGGEQDAVPGAPQLLDAPPQGAPRLRVEPGGGLVEQQEQGVVDGRDVERQPLLLAAGELLEPFAGLLVEPDGAQAVGDPVAGELDAVETAEQPGQLLDAQLGLEARRLQLDPEPGLRLQRLLPCIHPVDEHPTGTRGEQPLDRAQRAGLARTVRTEEPEDLAAFDPQGDARDRDTAAVGDHEVVDAQGRRRRRLDGIAHHRQYPTSAPAGPRHFERLSGLAERRRHPFG